MKNILVLLPLEERHKVVLKNAAPDASFEYSNVDSVNIDLVKKANIIIGNLPVKLIAYAKKLEWLQLTSSGVGEYADGILPKHVTLTCATGVYGLAVSEHMLATILTIYKKLHLYRDHQLDCKWSDEGQVKTIEGTIAIIIGLGDIGSSLAKKLKALGAYVIGVRRSNKNKPDFVDELHLMDQLEMLLPRADIIAFILPGTKETFHLVDKRLLKLMKKDAVLLNAGRGSLIDQDALCNALDNGELLAAGLDVTDPEPLPTDHRLWKIRNVIITPHVSGFFHLPETKERLVRFTAKNIEAYFNNKQLASLVDFATGYSRLN